MSSVRVDRYKLAQELCGVTDASSLTSCDQADRWIQDIQSRAKLRFMEQGVPLRADENWKFTDPEYFTNVNFKSEALSPHGNIFRDRKVTAALREKASFQQFADDSIFLITMVDGVLRYDLSNSAILNGFEGIEACVLQQEIMRSPIPIPISNSWYCKNLGRIQEDADNVISRPLANLNTALFQDGICLRITGNIDKPIHIRHLNMDNNPRYSRVLLVLEEGSSVTLMDSSVEGSKYNIVLEVIQKKGSKLNHIRSQVPDTDTRVMTSLFAHLEDDAFLSSFTLTAGGGVVRNETVVHMQARCDAKVAAAAVSGDRTHVDNTVFVGHQGPGSSSRQVIRMVMQDEATGVFQGKIKVDRLAQQTDGYQKSQALLLSDTSNFKVKPELEIYADDVKCSHGSTTSDVDPEKMFYLMSRGYSIAEARSALVEAFIADCINEIDDSLLRECVFDTARIRIRDLFSS